MELDEVTLLKIFHCAVDKFIISVKNQFPNDDPSIQKLFYEIVKRNESVTQNLRSIVLHAKTSLESSALNISDVDVVLNDKIQKAVHDMLSQDFLEFALSEEEKCNISDDDLHIFLYSHALKDVTNFSPSSIEVAGSFSFPTPLSTTLIRDIGSSTVFQSLNSGLLSSQFENARLQFEDEISELRRIAEKGFSISDLNAFNIATIGKYESSDVLLGVKEQHEFRQLPDSAEQNYFLHSSPSTLTDSDLGIMSDFSDDNDGFLSWEGCMGKFLLDHSYISEVAPEAAIFSISEKESHMYCSLLNTSDAISEDDMVHDILDLLIGIPSNTFFYDIHSRRFIIKSDIHLPNLSSECTAKIVTKFIESGSMYYALQTFSRDFLHASEGLIFRGMQNGVQQILSMYKEYIVAVKVNHPSMLFLRSDVLRNADLLQSFGVICGIDPEKMIIKDIPKGLGLLSHLHDIARSHKRKENGIMIAVLLKFAYAPYFSFINEWMTDGICNDPYGEFQIMEDYNYLERRDSLFWKFAYTENIDDPSRVVPLEIKHFSEGILVCGKSIGLLKICCPSLPSLKFFSLQPPPSLSMIYSFPATICKLQKCIDYIKLNEKTDQITNFEVSDESIDRYHVESQELVNKKVMLELVLRRQNIMVASNFAKLNILDIKKVPQYVKEYESYSNSVLHPKTINKCKCLPLSVDYNKDILKWSFFRNIGPLFSSCSIKCINENIFKMTDFRPFCFDILKPKYDDTFNGQLYENIGLLFSSCGYVEMDIKSDNLSSYMESNLTALDFGKQLQLLSYTQNSFRLLNSNYKQLLSAEMKFLDAFCNNIEISKGASQFAFQFQSSHSSKEEKVENKKAFSENLGMIKKPNVSSIDSIKKNVRNSFIDKVASLLVSEYGDTIDDVFSCIKVTSLRRLMMHNFNAVLKMRICLIEKVIMKYIVKELGLDSLLYALRSIYFLQNETFSQSLCEPLFSLVMKCRTPGQFANWAVLNEILMNAVSICNYESNPFLLAVNANVAFLPEEMPIERTDFLRLFIIEFEIKWPLNIIVHQTCIQQYLKIFSILLEIEFLCWLLGRIWRILIMTCKDLHLDDTPQFRDIMHMRFDMDQFVRVIRNSIHQHLQGPLREYLDKSLSNQESGIDALENIHMQYLEKALARCFLTEETHVLHELLSTMLRQIYKFCSAVFDSEWEENDQNGHYETYAFKGLAAAFETYKKYQKVFLKRIMKESLTKKCGRYWDKDYQDFLETILEIGKNC